MGLAAALGEYQKLEHSQLIELVGYVALAQVALDVVFARKC